MNLYYCKGCDMALLIDSEDDQIKSICEKTGKIKVLKKLVIKYFNSVIIENKQFKNLFDAKKKMPRGYSVILSDQDE